MHILLYVPDNQVTSNFVPQLWPFILKRLTPPGHRVTIIDGNAVRYTAAELVDFIRRSQVDLVGMGFMTRMAQKAYTMATAIRESTGVPIVMGGPHVTEVPDEPLGRTGGPRYADAVVLGEADDTWPIVVSDAATKRLGEIYRPGIVDGQDVKPTLQNYPVVPWDEMDLALFDLMRFVPGAAKKLLKKAGVGFERAYVIPVESGRGCPYGCEFCTVTGFFGDQIRFRDNANVIGELKRLKALSEKAKALVMVFFIDDNFAINRPRTKALLRAMIAEDVCLPWIAQISINLLEDEELVELAAASGCRWIFIGLESLDPASLKVARKDFNKPAKYASVLENLARHDLYAITSFIYGMESDCPGVSQRTVREIDSWPPGLPVFGLLTPYPATPLYDRLKSEGRLTRPEHWLDFRAFKTAFVPKNLTADEAEAEVRHSWAACYGPAAFRRAHRWLRENEKPFGPQLMHFVTRAFFRGIYFSQKSRRAWLTLLAQNVPTILSLGVSGFRTWWRRRGGRAMPAQVASGDAWIQRTVPRLNGEVVLEGDGTHADAIGRLPGAGSLPEPERTSDRGAA